MSNHQILSHISKTEVLTSPEKIRQTTPLSDNLVQKITQSRQSVIDILTKKDHRFLMVVGPCSIHNPQSAIKYAKKLKELSDLVSDQFLILMRVYFEKPRTTTGWKGLIYDPDLNGEYNIIKGIGIARQLMIEITQIGLPIATELLDPMTSAYLFDLVSWAGIGARTTESPTHRQLASGLPSVVGFKNGTDGNIQIAVDAISAAYSSHSYIGMLEDGKCGIFRTEGNPNCHLVLRGSSHGVNYDAASIAEAKRRLADAHVLNPRILIDCSHGNSAKDYTRQKIAFNESIKLYLNGEHSIMGVMLESFLKNGQQKLVENISPNADISVTDSCISFDETESLIKNAWAQFRDKKIVCVAESALIQKESTMPIELPKTVAFLGPDGTFTQLAAKKYFGNSVSYCGLPNVDDVFQSVASQKTEVGCVPFENSSEGIFTRTLDLLMQYPLHIIAEFSIPVRLCLLGVKTREIKVIYCQTHVKGQCRSYLGVKFSKARIVEVESNALAAEYSAKDEFSAAVGSEAGAELYGLDVLEKNIADIYDNTTRFLIISRKACLPSNHDKTSICFCISDRTGVLYDCLAPFQKNKITLTMIESRPSRKKKWEYLFYVDFLGNQNDENIKMAIHELNNYVLFVRILGSYPLMD